jgi:hypothetical protein
LSPEAKRLFQVNLLVAISTGFALALLVLTATVYASPALKWRYVALAPAVLIVYLLLKRLLLKNRFPRRPLVDWESPLSVGLAGLLPLIIILCAGAAAFWPGRDFGLAVIVGTIWFGLTIEGVLDSRKDPAD